MPSSSSRLCPHDRKYNGRYCNKCPGGATCSHGNTKRYCKRCDGSALCRHGTSKRTCKVGGLDSSCGKDLCEHRHLKRKCVRCQKKAVLLERTPGRDPLEFDVAPWQLERMEELVAIEEKEQDELFRELDFSAALLGSPSAPRACRACRGAHRKHTCRSE